MRRSVGRRFLCTRIRHQDHTVLTQGSIRNFGPWWELRSMHVVALGWSVVSCQIISRRRPSSFSLNVIIQKQ
ncbi:hypothetical protein LINGRAHAP2_LOCUS35754 [Linum grandiflorum]